MATHQLVHQNGDRLFVTSRDISNRFGKRHDNVLRDIENLECSPEFKRLNFEESVYHNSQNKELKMHNITRDGFVFLCMGFTGPQAAIWKERYITAFNEMEQALRASPPVARQELSLAREVGSLRDMVAAQSQAILALYQQIDSARMGHIRALSKMVRLQDSHQKLLAGQEKQDAKEAIIRLEAEGVPRAIIAQRTGRTLNHIRQVVFQARQSGVLSEGQGNLAFGDAA